MGKDIIKQILRENLGQLPVREAEPKAEEGQDITMRSTKKSTLKSKIN